MTDREKLIELISVAEDKCDSIYDCDSCEYVLSGSCRKELIADYLLANDAIVPTCKVGDTVYQVYTLFEEVVITELKVVELTIDNKGIKTLYGATNGGSVYCFDRGHNLDQIKFTKEKAEEKLKEREG